MRMPGSFKPNVRETEKERKFNELIESLKHKDQYVRYEAASTLRDIGDPRAVEPLINALNDSEFVVCSAAVEGLEKIGDARAVEPFINTLKNETSPVRAKVAKALIKIGDERAVDPLIQYLKSEDNNTHLWDIASVFGQIGGKHDKFDPVYDEVARRLDLPEERGPEVEMHYTGPDVEEAIAKLRTAAIPQTPIITELQVQSRHKELRKVWGEITLRKGTVEEISDALRPRLEKDSKATTFDGFQVLTYYFQKFSQVESTYQTTFRGYRIWRTEKALFACYVEE